MRKPIRLAGLLAIPALTLTLATRGAEPPVPSRTMPAANAPVISTHQIDRYDAITSVQQTLKENPKSLADWVILGELTHEVALDLPADQAVKFFRMSRDAYEKALALNPDNQGLKAAVQFAQDQEANAKQFESARDRGVAAYLDARRRDLTATNYAPTLRTYGPAGIYPGALTPAPDATAALTPAADLAGAAPAVRAQTGAVPGRAAPAARTLEPIDAPAAVTPAAVTPAANNAATRASTTTPETTTAETPASANRPVGVVPGPPGSTVTTDPSSADTATANMGTKQLYTAYPVYQTYYGAQGVPYTFRQFSNNYYYTPNDNRSAPPMSMQRYLQLMPRRMLPATEQPTGSVPPSTGAIIP